MQELAETNKLSIDNLSTFMGEIFEDFHIILLYFYNVIKVKMLIFGNWWIFKEGNIFMLITIF